MGKSKCWLYATSVYLPCCHRPLTCCPGTGLSHSCHGFNRGVPAPSACPRLYVCSMFSEARKSWSGEGGKRPKGTRLRPVFSACQQPSSWTSKYSDGRLEEAWGSVGTCLGRSYTGQAMLFLQSGG